MCNSYNQKFCNPVSVLAVFFNVYVLLTFILPRKIYEV